MKYLKEYLDKYGADYFIEKPVNEIDILIFSQLIYNDFKGIFEPGDSLTIGEAAVLFYDKHSDTELEALLDVAKRASRLLTLCAHSKRFRSIRMAYFIDNINDAIDKQICAVNFLLPDDSRVVSFRGTDASVTGFKESAMLAYMFPIPAQIEALHYFQETAMLAKGDVYACGHSKGGNLAVFAAVNCSNSLKRKIKGIYAFDAPGFPSWFFERYDYRQIREQIMLFNPQSSIVGRALTTEKEPQIVRSDAKRLNQHNVATWLIEDDHLVTTQHYDEESDKLAAYLNDLVEQIGEADWEAFCDAMEQTANQMGVSSFYDIKAVDTHLLNIVIDSIQTLTPEQKVRFRALARKVMADAAKDYMSQTATKAKSYVKNITSKIPLGKKKTEEDAAE